MREMIVMGKRKILKEEPLEFSKRLHKVLKNMKTEDIKEFLSQSNLDEKYNEFLKRLEEKDENSILKAREEVNKEIKKFGNLFDIYNEISDVMLDSWWSMRILESSIRCELNKRIKRKR